MSKTRKKYFMRLIGRIIILIICFLLYFFKPNTFDIILGCNFFKSFSIFHILWGIWIFDMILQLLPLKNKLPLGSHKLFSYRFKKSDTNVNLEKLKNHILSISKAAYKIFIVWTLLTIGIGILYYLGIIDQKILLLISVTFYVCDLICVLIWCPFRLIMGNKCCTTCRIFNWDHLMMFSPLIFIGSFFTISLLIFAAMAWLLWEICILIYPERFSSLTNVSLKCSSCTDKLCTQYCKRLRK